jgi:hypothetical protein
MNKFPTSMMHNLPFLMNNMLFIVCAAGQRCHANASTFSMLGLKLLRHANCFHCVIMIPRSSCEEIREDALSEFRQTDI